MTSATMERPTQRFTGSEAVLCEAIRRTPPGWRRSRRAAALEVFDVLVRCCYSKKGWAGATKVWRSRIAQLLYGAEHFQAHRRACDEDIRRSIDDLVTLGLVTYRRESASSGNVYRITDLGDRLVQTSKDPKQPALGGACEPERGTQYCGEGVRKAAWDTRDVPSGTLLPSTKEGAGAPTDSGKPSDEPDASPAPGPSIDESESPLKPRSSKAEEVPEAAQPQDSAAAGQSQGVVPGPSAAQESTPLESPPARPAPQPALPGLDPEPDRGDPEAEKRQLATAQGNILEASGPPNINEVAGAVRRELKAMPPKSRTHPDGITSGEILGVIRAARIAAEDSPEAARRIVASLDGIAERFAACPNHLGSNGKPLTAVGFVFQELQLTERKAATRAKAIKIPEGASPVEVAWFRSVAPRKVRDDKRPTVERNLRTAELRLAQQSEVYPDHGCGEPGELLQTFLDRLWETTQSSTSGAFKDSFAAQVEDAGGAWTEALLSVERDMRQAHHRGPVKPTQEAGAAA